MSETGTTPLTAAQIARVAQQVFQERCAAGDTLAEALAAVYRDGLENGGAKLLPKAAPRQRASGIPCEYELIVAQYHEHLPMLPAVKVTTGRLWEQRKKVMREWWEWVLTSTRPDSTRRAETAEQAVAWFGEYFATAARNDFLTGKTQRDGEHKGWRADLDFLLTQKGRKHVIEKTE